MNKNISIFTLLFLISNPVFAGTVTGAIHFSGTAPKPELISMNADPVCSSLHSTPVYQDHVVVNSNGMLQNVFIYIKEGLKEKPSQVPKEPVTIDQKGCQYSPHVLGIQTGQPFQIINSDETLHNIHSLAQNTKQFNLGMPIQGMKMNKQFEKPEVMVKLKCDVHPWMNAYVGVLDHPYFAVSGADGSFHIQNVPPGEYVIEAWHEMYGTKTESVTVAEGEVAAEFTFNG